MGLNQNLGDWIRWLNGVRFLVITLLLAIVCLLYRRERSGPGRFPFGF